MCFIHRNNTSSLDILDFILAETGDLDEIIEEVIIYGYTLDEDPKSYEEQNKSIYFNCWEDAVKSDSP